jgi:hypothetical protein
MTIKYKKFTNANFCQETFPVWFDNMLHKFELAVTFSKEDFYRYNINKFFLWVM